MLVLVGLDDSDEVFKELDELIMNADLDGCEEEKKVVEVGREKDLEDEIRELIGDGVGLGIEFLGIDIDNITSDNLEDFLNFMDNPDPNEKIDQGNEQVNAIYTRSGFSYGDEEERNGNEKLADLGTTAPQSSPLRRSGGSDRVFSFVDQLGATQSSPLRRSGHPDPENDKEVELEVNNQVGDESIIPSKVEELKTKGISIKPVDLLCFLTWLEKYKVLQGKDDENEKLLKADDFLDGKPIMNGAEKDKYGGEDVDLKRWKDGMIMRETKEWHDAWSKTRYELDVSNYEILFDDLICRYIGRCNVLRSWYLEGNRGKLRFQS